MTSEVSVHFCFVFVRRLLFISAVDCDNCSTFEYIYPHIVLMYCWQDVARYWNNDTLLWCRPAFFDL